MVWHPNVCFYHCTNAIFIHFICCFFTIFFNPHFIKSKPVIGIQFTISAHARFGYSVIILRSQTFISTNSVSRCICTFQPITNILSSFSGVPQCPILTFGFNAPISSFSFSIVALFTSSQPRTR